MKGQLTPMKAIRAKCLDCCCGSPQEVRLCPCVNCSLYRFRLGHNPARKRDLTDEERRAAGERLRKARNGENFISQQSIFEEAPACEEMTSPEENNDLNEG